MNEFEDDGDIEINAPLDIRWVILGLSMMVSGLVITVFAEDNWIKYVGAVFFLTSFLIIAKKQKETLS